MPGGWPACKLVGMVTLADDPENGFMEPNFHAACDQLKLEWCVKQSVGLIVVDLIPSRRYMVFLLF
jgi:hypothetical protein